MDGREFRVLGVIPARGGSKSIPKKNIVDLCGKPLLAYTIDAAKASCSLSAVVVSTDCEEIAAVARQWGAAVPFMRPDHLATDDADSLGVVLHALHLLEAQEKCTYDAVVLLQPTTPFRTASWIDASVTQLAQSDLDSVISVVDVGAIHPYRMYGLNGSGCLTPFVDGVADPMMPRQKLPPVYIRSGDIYATRRQCLVDQKSLIGRRPGGFVIDPAFAVNIDEPADLEIARLKMKQVHLGR
jgi:CMP-N,N'-diacetyllegionaminic acid synthase